MPKVNRRELLQVLSPSVRPLIIASPNGHYYRNGGPDTCVERAFGLMTGGADVLEALVEGVSIVELDPEEDSVGYGGLPNADGVVQLDACCMHGPTKRAGGVGALEGVRTPARVAHAVMQSTDHHLLVGDGAQEFARAMGFSIEDDLNTERSRRQWLEWKRRTDPSHYLPERRHGTINADGVDARGAIAGVTTTSGLAWKIPGRVGDSPILGAGLYVAGDVGAAGSTGRGEANLYGLCSFHIVENLRQGMSPKDAGMDAMKRIAGNTVEKRLLNDRGLPNFNVSFYIVDAKGRHAGVALYGEDELERGWAGQREGRLVRYALCTENGAEIRVVEPLYEGAPQDP